MPRVIISEAVAVQIYVLVIEEKCFSLHNIAAVYLLLASLAHGARVAPDPVAAKRLKNLLARSTKPLGLVPALRLAARRRSEDSRLVGMSSEAATAFLLKESDLRPLDFHFGAAGGGGGGDGTPGPAGSCSEGQDGSDPPAPRKSSGAGGAELDVRTVALDRCLAVLAHEARRAAEASGRLVSAWASSGGALPLDVLELIDERVRMVPLRHQAKRELTFERKHLAACALLAEERERRAAAECELVKLALQPQRDRRMLEHERAERLAAERQAAESHAAMRAEAEAAAARRSRRR